MVENKSSDADMAENENLQARLQELNEERELLEAANDRILSLLQGYHELLDRTTGVPARVCKKRSLSNLFF